MTRVVAVFILAFLAARGVAVAQSSGDQLVMFEEKSCSYCVVWDREVGKIYGKTDEAKQFPLRRVELGVMRPADLRSIKNVHVAPTFVILHCGREAGRITGYIGEDQFWGLLDATIRSLEAGTSDAHSASSLPACKD